MNLQDVSSPLVAAWRRELRGANLEKDIAPHFSGAAEGRFTKRVDEKDNRRDRPVTSTDRRDWGAAAAVRDS